MKIIKKFFDKKNGNPVQENTKDSIKEKLDKLTDSEKVEVKEYLENSLKDYKITELRKELEYADDIERIGIIRKLNRLLDLDDSEEF